MNDKDPILAVMAGYKQAVYEKNVEAFLALYDESVTVFDMWGPQWVCQGIRAWGEMARDWLGSLGSERVVVEFDDLQVRQTLEMATVTAYVTYTAVSGDGTTLRSLQNRMTCTLEKRSGPWLITHEHTSGPIDHNTLKASLRRSP